LYPLAVRPVVEAGAARVALGMDATANVAMIADAEARLARRRLVIRDTRVTLPLAVPIRVA
jgi:hypothetical protein